MMDENGVAEANRLYWETDTSVAEIADRFDLSRRAFYELITPLRVAAACPSCGQVLNFENRSARRDRQATCPECGAHTALEPGREAAPDAMRDPALESGREAAPDAMRDPAPAHRDLRADGRAVVDTENARTADLRGRAVLLGGAAIAGVAFGTVAALLARRRD